MYRNLSEFIARLEREGELQRVSVPVDPVYEIAEITDRMSKQPDGGKAVVRADGDAVSRADQYDGFRPSDGDGARRGVARRTDATAR